MKSVRLQPVKRLNATPKEGDLCYNRMGLFIWSEAHETQNVKSTLVEYRDVDVVDLALVIDKTKDLFPVGAEVITSRWYKETVKETYPAHHTFRTTQDNYLFEWHQAHEIVMHKVTTLYERVYLHDENDVFIGTSLKEHSLMDLIRLLGSNDYAYLTIESGKDGIRLHNGCPIDNKHLAN